MKVSNNIMTWRNKNNVGIYLISSSLDCQTLRKYDFTGFIATFSLRVSVSWSLADGRGLLSLGLEYTDSFDRRDTDLFHVMKKDESHLTKEFYVQFRVSVCCIYEKSSRCN